MNNPRPPVPHTTGMVGSGWALGFLSAYAYFTRYTLPRGGPLVPNAARWLPLHAEHKSIARDFFDVLGIIVLVYVVMACWEKLASRSYRWLAQAAMALGLGGAWAVALGVELVPDAELVDIGALEVSQFELVLGWLAILLLGVVAAFTVHHRRSLLCAAHLWPGAKRGFWRWFAGYATLWLLSCVVFTHPYFSSGFFANWRLLLNWLLVWYVVPGLPYCLVTNWLRYGKSEDRQDACFGLLVVYAGALRLLTRRSARFLMRALRKRWVRVNLLDLLAVKFFFLPVMISFLYTEAGSFFDALARAVRGFEQGQWFWGGSYDVALHSVLFLDVAIGVIGYAGSSRWLGNKSKSVDGTLSGWLWALLCYPPFNHASTVLLPFKGVFGTPLDFVQTPWVLAVLRGVELVCFAVYAHATIAFGLRFSNMTHRGIIKNGPYAFVRHPAYISKSIAWGAEMLPHLANAWQIIGLVVFSGIYFMRAVTEERHLAADPEYREYCRKVRWRFIPLVY